MAVTYNSVVAIVGTSRPQPSLGVIVAVALLTLGGLVVVVSALLGSSSFRSARIFIIAVTAANLIAAVTSPLDPRSLGAPFVNPFTAVAMSLSWVAFADRRVGLALIGALTLLQSFLRFDQVGSLTAIIGALATLAGSILSGIYLRLLLNAYDDVERAEKVRSQAQSDLIDRAERDRIRARWDRIVHDKILGALTLAGRSTTFRERDLARELAADAVHSLDQSGLGATTSAAGSDLRALASKFGLAVTGDSDLPANLDVRIHTHLFRAASEAFTNISRHAGVDHTHITVTQTEGGVSVEIADSGRGFDDSRDQGGYGLRHSMPGHMGAIGGRARVESVPGLGTRVTLSWPALTAPTEPALPADGAHVPFQWRLPGVPIVTAIPLIWVLAHVGFGWFAAYDATPPANWSMSVLLSISLFVIASAILMSSTHAAGWLAVALWVIGLYLYGSELRIPLHDWSLWVVGAMLPIPPVLLLSRRRAAAWTVALMAPCACWLGMLRQDHVPSPASVSGARSSLWLLSSFTAPTAVLIMVSIAFAALEGARRRTIKLNADLMRLNAASRRLEVEGAEAERRMVELGRDVLDLLQRVSAGNVLNAADRRSAVLMEASVRDSLVAPALARRVGKQADEARQRGATVSLAADVAEGEPSGCFVRMSRACLADSGQDSRVVLQWRTGHDRLGEGTILLEGPGSVTLLVDSMGCDDGAACRVDVDNADEELLITVHPTTRPDHPRSVSR